jgi:hypothetical protein
MENNIVKNSNDTTDLPGNCSIQGLDWCVRSHKFISFHLSFQRHVVALKIDRGMRFLTEKSQVGDSLALLAYNKVNA